MSSPLPLYLPLLVGGLVLALVVGVAIWIAAVQKGAVVRQQQEAERRAEESMALARRSVDLSEQVALDVKQFLRNQDEMIRLLRALAGAAEQGPGGIKRPGL
jgi:hypothetical protein